MTEISGRKFFSAKILLQNQLEFARFGKTQRRFSRTLHDLSNGFTARQYYFSENKNLILTCNDENIPTDENNLIIKAAKLLQNNFGISKRRENSSRKKYSFARRSRRRFVKCGDGIARTCETLEFENRIFGFIKFCENFRLGCSLFSLRRNGSRYGTRNGNFPARTNK